MTDVQKRDFALLQIAIIEATGRQDMPELVRLQEEVFSWIDNQIDIAVMKAVQPFIKMKVKRTYGNRN
jgi:hypothetical protein